MTPNMFYLVAFCAVLVPTLGRPQSPAPAAVAAAPTQPQPPPAAHPPAVAAVHPQPAAPSSGSTPIPIISQTEIVGVDGSFNYSYETGDGIRVQQGGYVKKAAESRTLNASNPEESNDIQVIQGTYSYTAPDGQTFVLKYVADENGFQPEGDHLPTPPPTVGQPPEAHPAQQQQNVAVTNSSQDQQ